MARGVPGRITADWAGELIVIAGAGPSLRAEQLERARAADARVIVVNESWRLAPWADLLYACDRAWWQHRRPTPFEFAGRCMTQVHRTGGDRSRAEDQKAVAALGLEAVESYNLPGLSLQPDRIHIGGNGGYQALNIAVLLNGPDRSGLSRIVLLGFDMKAAADGKVHWHGAHPHPLTNPGQCRFWDWISRFETTLADLARARVEVINASEETNLECFKRMSWRDALPI